MLLTFRVKLEKILDKSKTTTIRILTSHREKYWVSHRSVNNHHSYNDRNRLVNDWEELAHIWWLNPRNCSKFCRKIGITPLVDIQRTNGKYLNEIDAKKDGFDSLDELLLALVLTNNISKEEVLNSTWLIYSWDPNDFNVNPQLYPHDPSICKDPFCPVCKETKEEDI